MPSKEQISLGGVADSPRGIDGLVTFAQFQEVCRDIARKFERQDLRISFLESCSKFEEKSLEENQGLFLGIKVEIHALLRTEGPLSAEEVAHLTSLPLKLTKIALRDTKSFKPIGGFNYCAVDITGKILGVKVP